MTLETRNKNCSCCYEMNSISIVYDICYFIENSNICRVISAFVLATSKFGPPVGAFELKLIHFLIG